MLIFIVAILFCAFLIARYYESGAAREYVAELHRVWKSLGIPGQIVAFMLVAMCTLSGGSKGVNPAASLFRMLFWHGQEWALLPAFQANTQAVTAVSISTNAIATATNNAAAVESYVASNNTVMLSFDWHSPDRLPYNDRQNVLGRTVWVQPTNINGVACEDHYVAFNEAATTNPAVILIEYARTRDDGTVERFSSETITNSFPVMVPITVQSGTHTCYWFRCEIPIAFTNAVRDWNGEALFGSPTGSGKGFDLLGTLVIDDGNNIWEGATTNMVVDGVTNAVKNGIILRTL
jgi:hypothetical protein